MGEAFLDQLAEQRHQEGLGLAGPSAGGDDRVAAPEDRAEHRHLVSIQGRVGAAEQPGLEEVLEEERRDPPLQGSDP